MYITDIRERFFSRAGHILALLCMLCIFLPAAWMLQGTLAFGMEDAAAAPAFGMEDAAAAETETEAEAASCTVFIYMCGSNLESKYGLGTENLDELISADIPDSTTVVIETGGTSRWWSMEMIADDRLQRYIVRDHHLELVEELDNASMGSADTFCDFLRWGQENYLSERNILVVWDHGGSSADGVCFDENFGYDCMDRSEMVEAFDRAKLQGRFDLLCLDTCYMGELLNARLFSEYARYMTASQTIVPGPGMNYRVLAEGAAGPDMEAFGRRLCDTFIEKCSQGGRADEAQLSFYDLDAADDLIKELDRDARIIKRILSEREAGYELYMVAERARISDTASKSNVIDMMHLVNTLTFVDWSRLRKRIRSRLDDMLLYQVSGEYADLNGVSIFYPLNYSEDQLKAYEAFSYADNYCALLDEIYSAIPEDTISFSDPGSIGTQGTFDMTLAKESRPYLRNVILRVWKENALAPGTYTLLGDRDVQTYISKIGRKLSDLHESTTLNDEVYALGGHPLLVSVSSRIMTQSYSAPICVNGEDTSYTFVTARSPIRRRRRIIYTMLGSFFDENGLATRLSGHLKKGDKVSVYSALDEDGESLDPAEAFTVTQDDPEPEKIPLPEGRYRCQYIVTDIIGRTFCSDYGVYEITENDGERDVKLTDIVKNDES